MRPRFFIVASLVAVVAGGVTVPAKYDQNSPPGIQQPRPGQQSPMKERDRVTPNGFSVVLVVADLQASSAQDDVPSAARRALTDMKEFLPYKSYKLVDAAWILGQSTSGTSTRLRGPEEQDYELRLYSNRAEGSRVSVRFTLNEGSTSEPTAADLTSRQREELANRDREQALLSLKSQLTTLEGQLQEAQRAKKGASGDEARRREERVKDLQARVMELQARVTEAQRRYEQTRRMSSGRGGSATRPGYTPRPSGPRTIIDTSFTMDVGETVVVGTSRLKSNSKALIALLTAVPPKGPRPISETR